MLYIDFDVTDGIVQIRPEGPLDKEDFGQIAELVDPYIEENGDLAGVILNVKSFPGWDGFGAFVNHIKFVREHHKHVKKVAVVTDSHIGDVAEHVASHFVSAQLKHFPGGDVDEARSWIASA